MQKYSRTSNTIYNTGSNLFIMILKYLLTFISRTFFIKFLGETYLGINELLVNIIYMLSIAELGLNSAIGYSLYKPIVQNDNEKISQILTLFRKLYKYIGIIVSVLGIIIYFCLPILVKEYNNIDGIEIFYFLYLINTVSTYFISYKDILITADQKTYKLTKINTITQIISFILELISIIVFKSYIFYLLFKFIVLIIQKYITNKYISKEYQNINFNTKNKLDNKTIYEIKSNVKGLVAHKIGDYAVNGTDNIIISFFLDIVTVGYYSNYILLTKVVQNILSTFYNSVIPSFGNLIAENTGDNYKNTIKIFRKIDFLGFFLYSFFGIMFFNCSNIFIELWLGKEYLLRNVTVFLISFSFFLTGIRMASFSLKSAAGIFKEDSWGPFLQAIINLVISIVLCNYLGLDGIVIGTVISGFVPIFARIHYIYKIIFKTKSKDYYLNNFSIYILFYILTCAICYYICSFLVFNGIIKLVTNLVISFVIYVMLFIIVFRKYEEFKYLKGLIINLIRKVIKKNEK